MKSTRSLWMLFACAMFAAMGAFVKIASEQGASLPEIVMVRGGFSVAVLLPWVLMKGLPIRPKHWKAHVWRNISGIMSMWLGFYALTQLALPTAISLNYTAPLFIAGWMLIRKGDERDVVRTLAVVIGFLGVLGILQPSMERQQWFATLVGLSAGALSAVSMMQIRQLGSMGEPEWRTVLLFSLCVFLSGLIGVTTLGWKTSEPMEVLALIGLGLVGLMGQLAITRAFGMGSALLNAALQYTVIIFSALIGAVFWDESPALLAWFGMALIISSGLLSVWRTYTQERSVKKTDLI